MNNDINIIIHTTYFKPEDDLRNKEFLEAIFRNAKLSIISKIVIYCESKLALDCDKIITIVVGKRPNFKVLTSNFEDDAVNIICNSDTSFTKDLFRIRHFLVGSNVACFISRRSGLGLMSRYVIFKHNTGNSQDAWCFLGKLEQNCYLVEKLDKIEIGVPGNDNALVYVFKQLNYKILNPSYSITLLHHHSSEKRNYGYLDRLKLDYDIVLPSMGSRFCASECFIRILNLIYYKKW